MSQFFFFVQRNSAAPLSFSSRPSTSVSAPIQLRSARSGGARGDRVNRGLRQTHNVSSSTSSHSRRSRSSERIPRTASSSSPPLLYTASGREMRYWADGVFRLYQFLLRADTCAPGWKIYVKCFGPHIHLSRIVRRVMSELAVKKRETAVAGVRTSVRAEVAAEVLCVYHRPQPRLSIMCHSETETVVVARRIRPTTVTSDRTLRPWQYHRIRQCT